MCWIVECIFCALGFSQKPVHSEMMTTIYATPLLKKTRTNQQKHPQLFSSNFPITSPKPARFSQPAKLFINVKVCGCRAPNFSSQPSKARRKIRSASAVLPWSLEGADFGEAKFGWEKKTVFLQQMQQK